MRISSITEASVPPTDYGYWIKPLGEIVPVGDHGHEPYLRALGSNSATAMRQGWIRITTNHGFQAEACFSQVLPMAKTKLFLLAHQSETTRYYIDNHGYEGDYNSHFFDSFIAFQHGIDKLVEGEALTESILMSNPTDGLHTFYSDYEEALSALVGEYKRSGTSPRRWRVVPANMIKMVWQNAAKLGFVRSERAIDSIGNVFYKNILALKINNDIAEHTDFGRSKEEILEEYLDEDEMERFVDWAIECETGWRITDYGINPLVKYAALLAEEPSADDKLQICDAILNVVHPRSDLASWFVEGGSYTMSEIADQELTEDLSGFVDMMSDPRETHDMYRNGDVLTHHGEIGEVMACNERMVTLKMREDGRIQMVKRNDPELEVAPHSLW